jgi:hypothetical protein
MGKNGFEITWKAAPAAAINSFSWHMLRSISHPTGSFKLRPPTAQLWIYRGVGKQVEDTDTRVKVPGLPSSPRVAK